MPIESIKVVKGDITTLEVDGIVNAANNSLMGGGGVDGAIHRVGGPSILAECIEIRNRQGGCATGEAVITTGGNLHARYVIHTVGPVWQGGNRDEALQLENCYNNSLKLAEQYELKSLAFPNISTGVYHFPKENAATIAIQSVKNFLAKHLSPSEIIFACFDEENYDLYRRLLNH
jgi:O-acetyl-ADP-ribose deacetylase (regulator of RNase III)